MSHNNTVADAGWKTVMLRAFRASGATMPTVGTRINAGNNLPTSVGTPTTTTVTVWSGTLNTSRTLLLNASVVGISVVEAGWSWPTA